MLLFRRSKERQAPICCRFNASRNASCFSRIASPSLRTSLRPISLLDLFGLNARLLNDLAPTPRFFLDEFAHVGRAAARRQQVQLLESFAGLGSSDDLVNG